MPEHSPEIVFIGHSPVDIVAYVDDGFLDRFRMTKSHSNYMSLEQVLAVEDALENKELHSGGAAANSSVCYSALGGKAVFNGKIADDELGRYYYNAFVTFGVHVPEHLLKPHEAGCDRVYALITPDKERTFASYYGINGAITPDELDRDSIEKAQISMLEGYLMRAEGGAEALKYATAIAREAGNKVVFTPSDVSVIKESFQDCQDLFRAANMYIANFEETSALLKTRDLDEQIAILKAEQDCGVITLGPEGAVICTPEDLIRVSTAPMGTDDIMSTNGAGDFFAAGFLFGYLRNLPLDKAGRLGCLYATECLKHVSARPEKTYYDLIEKVL